MPTRPDAASPAAAAAGAEAHEWLVVADAVPVAWRDVAPTEAVVVGFYDPADDLERRTRRWQHRLPDGRLESLALFAAGLADAEADAWRRDEPHLATRAYEDRRFLLGDRILHWAVPWLDTAGRCYPEHREVTHRGRDMLLAIADRSRPAPDLGADTGLASIDQDAFGPRDAPSTAPEFLRSLWSGAVLLDATVRSLGSGVGDVEAIVGDAERRFDLATLYSVAAGRWTTLGADHSGSAALWNALAQRAARTAEMLGA